MSTRPPARFRGPAPRLVQTPDVRLVLARVTGGFVQDVRGSLGAGAATGPLPHPASSPGSDPDRPVAPPRGGSPTCAARGLCGRRFRPGASRGAGSGAQRRSEGGWNSLPCRPPARATARRAWTRPRSTSSRRSSSAASSPEYHGRPRRAAPAGVAGSGRRAPRRCRSRGTAPGPAPPAPGPRPPLRRRRGRARDPRPSRRVASPPPASSARPPAGHRRPSPPPLPPPPPPDPGPTARPPSTLGLCARGGRAPRPRPAAPPPRSGSRPGRRRCVGEGGGRRRPLSPAWRVLRPEGSAAAVMGLPPRDGEPLRPRPPQPGIPPSACARDA